ncbi:hypothetical protein [Pararhodospirillum oryzae]|uniref:Glycosyltransferase family 1 protein n=1 Tax=Pararhodospirillum oryzae TaxID=478448 RepID=A0A512H505_9PROT|nr:hypothetical protein [Pararhodospirillum oryzae]GEO80552.1 hypothetical protein ROR02_06830 [Pararhodospirillum oryzae]
MTSPVIQTAPAEADLDAPTGALLEECRRRGVFFDLVYEPLVIAEALIDGLGSWGVPCWCAQLPWSRLANGTPPRLQAHPERLDQAALVVIESSYRVRELHALDQPLFDQARALGHPGVFLTNATDHVNLTFFPSDLPVLTAHENRFVRVTGTRVPWAFGITRRMLANAPATVDGPRRPVFLRTFRPSMNQSVRDMMDFVFLPHLREAVTVEDSSLGVSVSGAEYLNQLAGALGCLAYGGFLFNNMTANPYFHDALYRDNMQFERSPTILRWDSWRLWECFLTGCVAITLDLDLYGAALPVLPTNWVHYVGLDLANLDRDIDRLRALQDTLPEIGAAGRAWALAHYTPRAQAARFLALAAHGAPGVQPGSRSPRTQPPT